MTIPGRYGLPQAARMEWIKLRSLRSTWWTLAVTVAGTVVRAVLPHFLSAWAGLGVLSLYAAIALAAGGWLLARRDA